MEVNILAKSNPVAALKQIARRAKGLKEGEADLLGFVSVIDEALAPYTEQYMREVGVKKVTQRERGWRAPTDDGCRVLLSFAECHPGRRPDGRSC